LKYRLPTLDANIKLQINLTLFDGSNVFVVFAEVASCCQLNEVPVLWLNLQHPLVSATASVTLG